MNNALFPTPEDLTLPEIMARFATEEAALAYFESIRWPDGPVCLHCGNADKERIGKVEANAEKAVRAGLYQCKECRKQFRATVGTVFEDSHIPLNKWLICIYITAGAKKAISALQMQRILGLGSYRTAWMMMHKLRHAITDTTVEPKLSGVIEADETFVGGKTKGKGRHYLGNKVPVVSVVERGGKIRSQVMPRVTAKNLRQMVNEVADPKAVLVTDTSSAACGAFKGKRKHYTVNHSAGEYARKEKGGFVAHSNTVESSFSLLKRSIVGSYHNVSQKHLPRYLAQNDFLWNHRKESDGEKTVRILRKSQGKRLT